MNDLFICEDCQGHTFILIGGALSFEERVAEKDVGVYCVTCGKHWEPRLVWKGEDELHPLTPG